MRKVMYLGTLTLVSIFVFFIAMQPHPAAAATEVLIFQPSGGANDGTDEGGATSGKDAGTTTLLAVNIGDAPSSLHFNSYCNSFVRFSYYQWDVSALPPAEDIVSVELVFHQRIGRNYGYQLSSTVMNVRAVTEPWNEMTLTGSNLPAFSPGIEASVAIPTVAGAVVAFEGAVSIDITDLYKDWRSGAKPNHGIRYGRDQLLCENTNFNFVHTSDHPDVSVRPALVITHSVAAPPTDTTPPEIIPTVTGSLGNNGWYTSNITIDWAVTDPESAVSSTTGCDTSTVTGDTSGATFNCEATSEGGTNSDSVMVKRDTSPPVIVIGTPADGDQYLVGALALSDWSVFDAMSGIAATTPATDGLPVDTSTPGSQPFTVTAEDQAGNIAGVTNNYVVLTAAQAVANLIDTIQGLGLHHGIENSLIAKLNAASKSLEKGKDGTAVHQLNSLINEIEALRDKKIDGAIADALITQVLAIMEAIDGGP